MSSSTSENSGSRNCSVGGGLPWLREDPEAMARKRAEPGIPKSGICSWLSKDDMVESEKVDT